MSPFSRDVAPEKRVTIGKPFPNRRRRAIPDGEFVVGSTRSMNRLITAERDGYVR